MYRFAHGHERMLTLIKITLRFPAALYSLIRLFIFNFRHDEKSSCRLSRQLKKKQRLVKYGKAEMIASVVFTMISAARTIYLLSR